MMIIAIRKISDVDICTRTALARKTLSRGQVAEEELGAPPRCRLFSGTLVFRGHGTSITIAPNTLRATGLTSARSLERPGRSWRRRRSASRRTNVAAAGVVAQRGSARAAAA